jgi:pyruvate/2-oxoglutarate dehydrogenase complex dihydrolipoamide dehydrogenase (E3) component
MAPLARRGLLRDGSPPRTGAEVAREAAQQVLHGRDRIAHRLRRHQWHAWAPYHAGVDRFDLVIIGAGAAGEAAAFLGRKRGASVAVIDRDLFGGSCAFWACMPSKALLHAAAVHAVGGDYPWSRASARRDWMINREGIDYPDDHKHRGDLDDAGATTLRGTARLDGPGRVHVVTDEGEHDLQAGAVLVAVGSNSRIPDLPGLETVPFWTNREATSTRELPDSFLILGGGPTGVELAQVYARYGVPVTLIESHPHILARDHPRSAEVLTRALRRDGVTVRTGVHTVRAHAGGPGGRHRVELDDGSAAEGAAVLLAIGRDYPLAELGLETVGADTSEGRLHPDERLRIAEGVYAAGDPAGPEMHTHVSHYEGEMAARIALGEDVLPDLRSIPRATYTEPESASVGLQLDEARELGLDAEELTQDLAETAKGYVLEAEGHISIVVDRGSGTLIGVFAAGPGVSEMIHEAVLAVKLRTPLAVLADTIHAFPTAARVMGTLFGEAAAG